ncbi:MAG: polyphenol oxidase family protein [Candidatus Fermentibacteraceae bacterium]
MTRSAAIPGTELAVFMAGVDSTPREVPREAVFLSQVHGAVIIDPPEPFALADGMILPRHGTRFPGVSTADCLPVFAVWDKVIGCAHAGWRGLAAGVLDALIEAGGGPPRAVVLGPCICGECYTVGEEVRSIVAENSRSGETGRLPGRLDLKEAAASYFNNNEQVYTVDMCTLCGTGLHSHRRNGTRMRNRFWLAPKAFGHNIKQSVSVKPYDHFTFEGSPT